MVQRSGFDIATFSRTVRMMTMVFFSSLVVGLMAISLGSASLFGVSKGTQELRIAAVDCREANNYCAPASTPQLRAAVDRQRARGLTCTSEPVLTDVILFQRSDDLTVDVLSFDDALQAAIQKRGWVQQYCSQVQSLRWGHVQAPSFPALAARRADPPERPHRVRIRQ